MILQIIILYASFAVVDIFDKFLLSSRKIQALQYTFFTVITGSLMLLAWPAVYEHIPLKFAWLNLASGAFFGLMMYVYFKVLSYGEVSRVVPVVFGLVPVFDIIFSVIFQHKPLFNYELSAMCLLIPGALLIAYYPGTKFFNHFGLKVLAAFLFSSYNWLWQYGAQIGGSLNNLMWNRLGAGLAMAALLLFPLARKNIFKAKGVEKKQNTGVLFIAKQILGGLNFILISYFLASGKVPIVDGLSAFRYVFLFIFALILSIKYKHVLEEQINSHTIKMKIAATALIFLGISVLFFGNL